MTTDDDTRSGRKRQAILQAATGVFLKKGYDGTSVDEIAAVAAVSKQTVYKHFNDKEQLFCAIVLATTDEIDQLVQVVSDALANTSSLEKDLGDLARQFMSALMQPHMLRLRRLVIANAERLPDVARAWFERGFERVLKTLAAHFETLTKQKRLRMKDPMLAAQHFVGLLLWIPINKAMFSGNDKSSTKADLLKYAQAAVEVFLAAYGRR